MKIGGSGEHPLVGSLELQWHLPVRSFLPCGAASSGSVSWFLFGLGSVHVKDFQFLYRYEHRHQYGNASSFEQAHTRQLLTVRTES